ncbi:MAG: hypothetical protein ACFFAN_05290 [Promethearchaeota archaeon]
MAKELRFFFLPFLIITVVIGYQIFVYFFYQYYKIRDEKLELNKILPAYGILFGLPLTGFLIRIINLYYVRNISSEIFNFLTKLTFLLLYSSFIIFFAILSMKSFRRIINLSLIKILSVSLIISIISIFILQPESLLFITIALITIVISYSYILYFQTKLIKLSTGVIKKRLKHILIGFLLCVLQHFFGGYLPSYVLFQQYSLILQLIAIPTFLLGLMIVFLGIFRFPAFLELGWKENLLNLFIIYRRNYKLLYTFDFKTVKDERFDSIKNSVNSKEKELFFSRGIIGINDIFHIVTKSNEKEIEKIKRAELTIFLKNGDKPINFVTYCLVVKKDMISFTYFLKSIKNQFQVVYKHLLSNLNNLSGKEEKLFSGFDIVLDKLME